MRLVAFTLLIASVSVVACSKDDSSSNGDTQTDPVRQSESPVAIGQVQEFGLAGGGILIDLALPARPDTWAASTCHPVLPTDFVIGQATCPTDATKTALILASQATQFCSDQPDVAVVKPAVGITVPGCEGGAFDISVYRLNPDLRITLDTLAK